MKPGVSVLANSLPRGGSFLLASALQLLGYHKYAGAEQYHTPAAFNYLEAKKALGDRQTRAGDQMIGVSPFAPCYLEQHLVHDWLGRLAKDEYIPAHIPWSPALPDALEGLQCRHIIILRDPRALLLSLLFDTHPMPRFLIEPFATLSPQAQLDFMLTGGEVPQAGMTLQPFAEVYRSMLAWQNAPDCLVVRYEALAGLTGGGSRERQLHCLQHMAAFLELPMDASLEQHLDSISDPGLPAFRQDQVAEWQYTVGKPLVEQVMDACEPLAHAAGYEELPIAGGQG